MASIILHKTGGGRITLDSTQFAFVSSEAVGSWTLAKPLVNPSCQDFKVSETLVQIQNLIREENTLQAQLIAKATKTRP
jgi:hypothetical protein